MPQRDKRVSPREAVRCGTVSFMTEQETDLGCEIAEVSECRQPEYAGRNVVRRSQAPLGALRMRSVTKIDEQKRHARIVERINRQGNHLHRNAAIRSARYMDAVSIERPNLRISVPGSNALILKRIRDVKKRAVNRRLSLCTLLRNQDTPERIEPVVRVARCE